MKMEDRYTLTDLPEVGEWYYAVEWFTYTYPEGFENREVITRRATFDGSAYGYAFIASGMAFKTKKAAENNKYAVYKALTGKEWGKE